jgi:hypothetical protein
VIKQDRRPPGVGLQVPHRKNHVIARATLFQIVDRSDLGVADENSLPATLYLIARPYPHKLAAIPDELALIKYWRLLFHCRVHDALGRRLAELNGNPAEIERRLHRLGHTEFDEIRRVLHQEKYTLPPLNDWTVFEEFAAVYLELRFFSSFLLPHYFPAIHDFDRVDALLAEDIDAKAIFAQTRLPGAPENPVFASVNTALQAARDTDLGVRPLTGATVSAGRHQRLLAKADKTARRGNVVRAAIYREQAARIGPPAVPDGSQASDSSELERLVGRLQGALELEPHALEEWRKALPPLLEHAASGTWPVEARLLYDLQRACVDHERGIYAVDIVEWAVTLGRRPVKRALPRLREAHLVKHLRKATARLVKVQLSDMDRQRLAALLHEAVHRSEGRLREKFRPLVAGVLERAGLTPHNYPERIALNKLIEELLDRIVERGFLNIGDLRDTISRNGLKLPDLSGAREFFRGDQLLRIDRELAVVLDGVYRRGEVYMRWLQRLSALAFGTVLGRLLTLYLILPFGGAFVVLKGAQEVVHLAHELTSGPEDRGLGALEESILTPYSFAGLALVLFGLFHVPPFRRAVGHSFYWLWLAARGICYDLPAVVLRNAAIRELLESAPLVFFYRFLLTPLTVAVLAWPVLLGSGYDLPVSLGASGAVFLVAALALNSRLGRDLEEATVDWLLRGLDRIRFGILPGIFHFVMDLFKRMLEWVERFLYSVDEWLRFKSGESHVTLVLKTILGTIWFFLTYLIRIYVNLLIEPTVNPIKHFPVVTVGHKIMAPLIPKVYFFLKGLFLPLGPVIAIPAATVTVIFVPGIFGFIVWELKENWRLYRANRPRTLKPALIGHHGETTIGLMRPGIHSGTLPKLFARLRKAERGGHRTGNWRAVHKQLEALHHVEESIRNFVDRELIAVLDGSKSWQPLRVQRGHIVLGSNRVSIEICCPDLSKDPLLVSFEDRSGWLMAGIQRAGWLSDLSVRQAQALATALAGFYKLAGVEFVREQIEACFADHPAYDVIPPGLIVRQESDFGVEAVYTVPSPGILQPQSRTGAPVDGFPALTSRQLMFREVPVFWETWVEAWQQDQDGKFPLQDVAEGVRVLPCPSKK